MAGTRPRRDPVGMPFYPQLMGQLKAEIGGPGKLFAADAWEIHFAMFAIGVFAGAVLMAGGGGRSRGAGKGEK